MHRYLFMYVKNMHLLPFNVLFLLLIPASVFAQGTSGVESATPRFSYGVIGGGALTDAFGHDSTAFVFGRDGGLESRQQRSYSTLKDYVIGPAFEVGIPWRGFSVELNALYRPLNLTMAGVNPDGSLHSISPATVVTWEFPVLAKYRFHLRRVSPFLEAGPSFRTSGNLNGAQPSVYGGTGGVGVDARIWRFRIGPVVRYTHWAAESDRADPRSRRNQVELLLGVSF